MNNTLGRHGHDDHPVRALGVFFFQFRTLGVHGREASEEATCSATWVRYIVLPVSVWLSRVLRSLWVCESFTPFFNRWLLALCRSVSTLS